MKRIVRTLMLFAVFAAFTVSVSAQSQESSITQNGSLAIVGDDRLSLLLPRPSLYALPIRRLRNGKRVYVEKAVEADGVTFYKVRTSESGGDIGYVQSEALVGNFRRNDDIRFAGLIYVSEGFEQIERISYFLMIFEKSKLRPTMLLLLGDLVEEKTAKLSRDALRKLSKREMAATKAPVHSFYLGFSGLDRYRKLGIRFLFNLKTRSFHYDGEAWLQILDRFPKSREAIEAAKRIDTLRQKMNETIAQ